MRNSISKSRPWAAVPIQWSMVRWRARFRELIARAVRPFPHETRERMHVSADSFVVGLGVVTRPAATLPIGLLSIAVWGCAIAGVWFCLVAFDLQLPPLASVLLIAAAVPDEVVRTTLRQIKDMGANFVRLGHYQQAPLVLDLCDELGLLVWEEIPWCRGGLGGERYQQQCRDMLRNLRVSPQRVSGDLACPPGADLGCAAHFSAPLFSD